MRYFSTFSGIGGFELGIQQAYEKTHSKTRPSNSTDNSGATPQYDGRPLCIGYSEIDKYATHIYGSHFPHPNFGSIRDIVAEELPDFDLLCGGFPCQSFSIAGKRGGFEDTRGTLFFDIARIAKVKRPRLLFLENVKGLLSHEDGRTFNTIIGTLDELGYDVQWQVLNSKNFGVPQNRERVFIIGHLRGTPRPQVFPFRENSEADIILPTLTTRYYGGQANGGYIGNITQLNDPPHSNDRVYGDGGISPTLNTMQGGNRQPFVAIQEPTKQGYALAEEGDTINLSVPNSKTRRGRVGKGVAQTLDTGMQQHTIQDMRIRRLTPVECERLQGFPDGWTKVEVEQTKKLKKILGIKNYISDSQRYKTLGNAVTVNVIQAIAEKLL